MTDLHDDELPIDVDLVHQLVARSFPEYADLPLRPLEASGSTNALYRLGEDLLVRLPRQPGGSESIDKEARWLPFVAAHVTTALPEVVGVGEPGFGYPERWAITTWLEGHTPSSPWDPRFGASAGLAEDLARTVRELRAVPVPDDTREDPDLDWYRGGSLADVDEEFHDALTACEDIPDLDLDLRHVAQVWDQALAADREHRPGRAWYHGDLFAENLLVRDGRLAAVLDAGGLAIGDPAVDLLAGFEVLDPAGLEAYRAALDVTDTEWARAKGWAVAIAIITFPYYWHTMPTRCAHRQVLATAASQV